MVKPTNADIEMLWIDAWNDLYSLIGSNENVPCLLPTGEIVSVDTLKGWIQDSVYEGSYVKVSAGRVGVVDGVVAHCWLR